MKKILIKTTPTTIEEAMVIDVCTFRDIRFYITQLRDGKYRFSITEPFSGRAVSKGNTIQEALENAQKQIMGPKSLEMFLRTLIFKCGGTILNDIPMKDKSNEIL